VKPCLALVFRVIWKEASGVHRRLGLLLTQEYSYLEGQEGSRNSPPPAVKQRALNASRWLSDLTDRGREQAGIDGARLLKRLSIDGDVDQGIEPTHGAHVARFGPFNAQVFGLAVDAFAAGALGIDGLVERPIAIEQSAHQAAFLPVGVFDAALAFGKLLMGTGLSSAGGKEQRTAKALGAIAVGMCEYGMIVTIESSLRLVQATFSALTMPASFPFVKTFQYRSLVRN